MIFLENQLNLFEKVDSSFSMRLESNWYIGGTTWEIGWGGGSRSSQPPPLLTPSIDNGFAVPLRNRDEEGGESIHGLLVNKAVVSRETDDN